TISLNQSSGALKGPVTSGLAGAAKSTPSGNQSGDSSLGGASVKPSAAKSNSSVLALLLLCVGLSASISRSLIQSGMPAVADAAEVAAQSRRGSRKVALSACSSPAINATLRYGASSSTRSKKGLASSGRRSESHRRTIISLIGRQ